MKLEIVSVPASPNKNDQAKKKNYTVDVTHNFDSSKPNNTYIIEKFYSRNDFRQNGFLHQDGSVRFRVSIEKQNWR